VLWLLNTSTFMKLARCLRDADGRPPSCRTQNEDRRDAVSNSNVLEHLLYESPPIGGGIHQSSGAARPAHVTEEENQ
jgi:hypothetical protein